MRRARKMRSQERSRSDAVSPAGRLWSELIWPALCVAIAAAGAVTYLALCAQISVIECDLARLEQVMESKRSREFELQRQLAELRHAERIQKHIVERGLQPPSGHRHIRLTDIPPSLYGALPDSELDRDIRDADPAEVAGSPHRPLFASTGYLRSGGDH